MKGLHNGIKGLHKGIEKVNKNMETYRSGRNENDSKSFWRDERHVGSNPTVSATKERTFVYQGKVRSFFVFGGKNAITGRNKGKKRLNGAPERSEGLHRRSFCVCGTGFGRHT